MKTIKQYLEEAARKAGNDSKLAKELGTTQPTTSKYRSGRRIPDATVCLQLANILRAPPIDVLAAAEIARAKTPERKRLWAGIRKLWARPCQCDAT